MACRKLAPCLMPRNISGQATTPRGHCPGRRTWGSWNTRTATPSAWSPGLAPWRTKARCRIVSKCEDPALGLSVGTRPWRQGRRGRPAPDPSPPTQLGLPSRPLHFWAHLCPTHGPQRRSRTGKCPGGLAWVGALRQRPECGEEVAGVGKEGPGPQPASIHLAPWGGGGVPLELRPRPDPHEPVRREGSCDGSRGWEGAGVLCPASGGHWEGGSHSTEGSGQFCSSRSSLRTLRGLQTWS